MSGGGQISALHLAIAASGGVLIYSALRNVTPLQALRDVTSGQAPPPIAAKTSSLGTPGGATQAAFTTSGAGASALVGAAEAYLGVPYAWAGTSRSGLDCSGLVVVSFQDAYGVTPPRTTYGQEPWNQLTSVTAANVQPGDLVFWPGHVAIYVGNGQVIAAPRPGKNVEYEQIGNAGPTGMGISSYKRYAGAGASKATPGVIHA